MDRRRTARLFAASAMFAIGAAAALPASAQGEVTVYCSILEEQCREGAALSPDAPKFAEMKLIDYDTPRWGSPAEGSRLLKRFDAEVKPLPR